MHPAGFYIDFMLHFIRKQLPYGYFMPETDKNIKKLEAKLTKLAGIAGTGCVWKISRFLLPEPELCYELRQHSCKFCSAVKKLPGKEEQCVRHDTVELVAQLKKNPVPQVAVCHAGVAELIVPMPPGTTGFTGAIMLGPFRVAGETCRYPEAEEAFRNLPELSGEAAEGFREFIPLLFDEAVRNAYADTAGLLPRRPRDERILTVLEYLHRHFAENPSTARVAATVFMSASRLQHLFRTECGIGIGEYQLQLRLRRARRFLLSADWPVGRVAERSGFASQSYFSAMFGREFGLPPLQYRRKFGRFPYDV